MEPDFSWDLGWDLRDHLQNPKLRNPEKSQKSLPWGVRDPWPRTPQKVSKKVRKVKKIVKINYFLDFSDLCRNFLGGPGSGVPNSSRETFWRLFGVSGFWVLLTSVDGHGDPKIWGSSISLSCLFPSRAKHTKAPHHKSLAISHGGEQIAAKFAARTSFFAKAQQIAIGICQCLTSQHLSCNTFCAHRHNSNHSDLRAIANRKISWIHCFSALRCNKRKFMGRACGGGVQTSKTSRGWPLGNNFWSPSESWVWGGLIREMPVLSQGGVSSWGLRPPPPPFSSLLAFSGKTSWFCFGRLCHWMFGPGLRP